MIALSVFMYVSTMLFMLGAAVFALHQTGFFENTMKYFEVSRSIRY